MRTTSVPNALMIHWLRTNGFARLLALFALATLLVGTADLVAQDESLPYAPGLLAEFRTATETAPPWVDASLAFHWGEASPHPALQPGPFTAKWQGYLMSEAAGEYRLHLFASGKVRLRLKGEDILSVDTAAPTWSSSEPLSLSFDWHPLELEYERGGAEPRLALYWTGPNFELEPIDERHLYHDANATPEPWVDQGRQLARALRCEACHRMTDTSVSMLGAPDLRGAAEYLRPAWLQEHLSSSRRTSALAAGESTADPAASLAERKMPYFALTDDDVHALVAFLSNGRDLPEATVTEAEAAAGRQLFLSIGCLACHAYERFGSPGLFGGGDLSQIARKRPPGFFAQWLQHPEKLNPRHRMPVFDLTAQERGKLAQFLSSLTGSERQLESAGASRTRDEDRASLAERGQALFRELRCVQCHEHPAVAAAQTRPASLVRPLSAASAWDRSCLGRPRGGQPGFDVTDEQQQAVRTYYAERRVPDAALAEPGRRRKPYTVASDSSNAVTISSISSFDAISGGPMRMQLPYSPPLPIRRPLILARSRMSAASVLAGSFVLRSLTSSTPKLLRPASQRSSAPSPARLRTL